MLGDRSEQVDDRGRIDHGEVGPVEELRHGLRGLHDDARRLAAGGRESVEGVKGSQIAGVVADEACRIETEQQRGQHGAFVGRHRGVQFNGLLGRSSQEPRLARHIGRPPSDDPGQLGGSARVQRQREALVLHRRAGWELGSSPPGQFVDHGAPRLGLRIHDEHSVDPPLEPVEAERVQIEGEVVGQERHRSPGQDGDAGATRLQGKERVDGTRLGDGRRGVEHDRGERAVEVHEHAHPRAGGPERGHRVAVDCHRLHPRVESMRRLRRSLTLMVLVGSTALGACREHRVAVSFDPEVGDVFRYRYELTATLTRELDGQEPAVTTIDTELTVHQRVMARTGDGARVRIDVERAGGARSTVVAVVDRAGSLEGIELVQGVDAAVFGIGDPQGLAADPAERLPDRPLGPGDRWTVEDGSRQGHARVERLGTEDDRAVIHVRTSTVEPLAQDTTDGEVRAGSLTTYDLADGAVRTGRAWSHGVLEALVEPPDDVVADAVRATVRYDVTVRVVRLDTT